MDRTAVRAVRRLDGRRGIRLRHGGRDSAGRKRRWPHHRDGDARTVDETSRRAISRVTSARPGRPSVRQRTCRLVRKRPSPSAEIALPPVPRTRQSRATRAHPIQPPSPPRRSRLATAAGPRSSDIIEATSGKDRHDRLVWPPGAPRRLDAPAAWCAPPPASAQQVNVQEVVLDNGLRVLMVPRGDDPNVAAGWVARVGSVNERPGHHRHLASLRTHDVQGHAGRSARPTSTRT